MADVTDRELLELAAKAANYTGLGMWDGKLNCLWDGEGWSFDPLNDDGDALRLAVKLGMTVYSNICHVHVWLDDVSELVIAEDPSDDYCAATRRAIVRAAASLADTVA